MAPSKLSETSPLLADGGSKNQYLNTKVIEDSDLNGNVSIVTTDDISPKTKDDDDLLQKRLNGSPLMVVLIGYVK